MYMARIVLQIDEEEKKLWVEQAHSEMVTLSEWIRRAGRERSRSYISDAPRTISISANQLSGIEYLRPAVEASASPIGPSTAEDGSADSAPPSTAPCRRHKIHHIYHAGTPCPLCGFPQEEVLDGDR